MRSGINGDTIIFGLLEEHELPVAFLYLEVEVDLRLVVEEAVGAQSRQQVHDEVVHAAVPGVHKLSHVLEHVVDRLYDAALAQHNLVIDRHELVFHVAFDARDDVHAVVPQLAEQVGRDISLVGIQLAEQLFCQHFNHTLVPVVNIGLGHHEVENLPLLVADQVKLEAHEPPHGALALCGHVLEHPHRVLPLVVDHRDAGAVDERDARALAEAAQVQEHHHGHEASGLQLDKPVIGQGAGKQVAPCLAHTLAVVVLEVAERVVMEGQHDGYDLGIAHPCGSVAAFFCRLLMAKRHFF